MELISSILMMAIDYWRLDGKISRDLFQVLMIRKRKARRSTNMGIRRNQKKGTKEEKTKRKRKRVDLLLFHLHPVHHHRHHQALHQMKIKHDEELKIWK